MTGRGESTRASESQVAALLNKEERMAMEFFIACAPEERRLSADLFLSGRTGANLHGCDLRQIAKGDAFGGGSERACKTGGTD